MIKGVHHAGVSVRNLDRSIEFYCNLGMELVGQSAFDGGTMDLVTALRGTSGRSAMLKAGGQHLELFEFVSPAPNHADALPPVCDHGITHICLEVADIQHEYRRLLAAGVRFHCEPQRFGDSLATYARDPDGNVVELLEQRTE